MAYAYDDTNIFARILSFLSCIKILALFNSHQTNFAIHFTKHILLSGSQSFCIICSYSNMC